MTDDEIFEETANKLKAGGYTGLVAPGSEIADLAQAPDLVPLVRDYFLTQMHDA